MLNAIVNVAQANGRSVLQQINQPGQYLGHSSTNDNFLAAMSSNAGSSMCNHLMTATAVEEAFNSTGINYGPDFLGWRGNVQATRSGRTFVRQLGDGETRVGRTDFLLHP
jgi:hypothetical protein